MGQAPCEPPDRIFLLSERICCWWACGTGGNGEPSLEPPLFQREDVRGGPGAGAEAGRDGTFILQAFELSALIISNTDRSTNDRQNMC